MNSKNRPSSKKDAPKTERSYERADPSAESGMGRLDNNASATPKDRPDTMNKAAKNAHANRQLNADDSVNARRESNPNDANPKRGGNADASAGDTPDPARRPRPAKTMHPKMKNQNKS